MKEKESDIREFQALMSLLDEPDQAVFAEISKKINSLGPQIIPFLENEWENSYDIMIRERVRALIREIQFNTIYEDFKVWIEDGCNDLLSACMILSRYQNPELSEDKIHRDISRIRKDIWLEMNDQLTALEQINLFNHIFYEVHGFSGNSQQYHAPSNSFLSQVLDTRKGNPLSLGVLYMLIAQSLDMPIFGVNMPEHFILVYTDTRIDAEHEWGIQEGLFYINAFSKGTLYSKQEVVQFIQHLGYDPKPMYFKPCSNEDIVRRMLNNLIVAYSREGEDYRVHEVRTLQSLFSVSP